AAAAERVQHKLAGLRESLDQRRQGFDRLLRRVQLVARIGEVDHVRDGIFRQTNIALRQQVSLFMLVAQELRRRRITLAEHDMSDNAETCRLPCVHEQIDLVPAVKRYGETSILQNTVHL